jgi:hypothetical protein
VIFHGIKKVYLLANNNKIRGGEREKKKKDVKEILSTFKIEQRRLGKIKEYEVWNVCLYK